ncbi:MAG: hypothetical protein M3289_02845 [Actinomycetota bacterium]|jgi:hypothetical protein|nr:hypothetical protein [Actinomycetota bacterium]MDQ5813647.1 hypothetical protein [Actinomycetota bacterium]
MQGNQRVADMAREVLVRQAGAHTKRAGEPLEDALKTVLKAEEGWQLGELRDGSRRDKLAALWQEDLALQRQKEREEQRRRQAAIWEQFMQVELRELKLRKEGQLARLLGKPLPGEPPAVLQQLSSEDQRQAEEGLVALMSDGEVYFKRLDELTPEDRPARIAAKRLRTAWIKERQAERQEKWGDHR